MIKIGHQVYSSEEIFEFVEKNKNSLLQTKNGGVIVAIQDGLCLVVSKAGRIYKAWPGEIELQWKLPGAVVKQRKEARAENLGGAFGTFAQEED